MLSGRIPIGKVKNFESEQVTIGGFVEHTRKLKNILFMIIRDFDTSIQVVFPKDKVSLLPKESVVLIKGKVSKKITGEDYEILGEEMQLLSTSEKSIPIEIGELKISEERHRMKYRYLDLRRKKMKENLVLNSKAKFIASSFLHSISFIEITTPILSFPSKEGAQTFTTIPNSNSTVSFTLAQSPQIYKQLLMIGGFEKYFQFSTSFRAEKLREDRQFEFTQLDIEMSFTTQEKIFELIEQLIRKLCIELVNITLPSKNFPILTYEESFSRYGTDKPDLRNPLEIFELFEKLNDPKKIDEFCFCISVESWIDLPKSFLSKIDREIKYLKWEKSNSLTGSYDDWILPYFERLKNSDSGIFFYLLENRKDKLTILRKMGELRTLIWKEKNISTGENSLSFVWIVDWPYFEHLSTGELKATHHPFTLPKFTTNYQSQSHLSWRSHGYDLVLNGVEIASGGQRITDHKLQTKIFQFLGLSEVQIQETFGWFLEALKYGTPPHLGIAIGWERFLQTLLNLSSIREVIAFPKNSHGICSMCSYKNTS